MLFMDKYQDILVYFLLIWMGEELILKVYKNLLHLAGKKRIKDQHYCFGDIYLML